MNRYRVVVVAPDGNVHSAAFNELAVALVDAICENGFQCDSAVNQVDSSAINILLGFHLLQPTDIPSNIRYIVYQLEQLSTTEGWLTHHPEMLDVLRGADSVWDYSPENIAFLAERNIDAKLIPAGFSPALKTIPQNSVKDVDVLFYGSRNERRGVVLQELLNRGYNVKALFGIYGEERDRWIARAKVVINIHYYEANLFESVRMSYLLSNGVAVVSESSPSYPWSEVPLKMVPYDQLVDSVEELLQDDSDRESYAVQCYQQFTNHYRQSSLIKPFLS